MRPKPHSRIPLNTTFDLLKPVVAAMNKTFTAYDIFQNTDGTFTLYTCCTLWLTLTYTVVIGGVEYTIIDLEPNATITLKGPSYPTSLTFDIYLPFFTHGTILDKQSELTQVIDSKNKLPMIWLHEKVSEKHFTSPMEPKERESDCDLYFMVDCDLSNWDIAKHNNYAVIPMRNMIDAFLDSLENSTSVHWNEINDYKTLDNPRFGQYQDDKGNTKQIFSDALSGAQLTITIPFLKSLQCLCP
jgi:hypothetical protein